MCSDSAVDVIDVFLLAENRLFREALAKVIERKSDLRVLGSGSWSNDTLVHLAELNPHVLLWDPSSSDPDLEILRSIRAAVPKAKIMMLGMDENAAVFLRCVRSGIAGYLLKEASANEVALAVRTVAYEGAMCSPKLLMQLFQYFSTQSNGPFQVRSTAGMGLSRREQQLLQLAGRGLTNKEIAMSLNLSEQTVKNHVHRILRKLNATDRVSAVEICRGSGLFV